MWCHCPSVMTCSDINGTDEADRLAGGTKPVMSLPSDGSANNQLAPSLCEITTWPGAPLLTQAKTLKALSAGFRTDGVMT